MNEILSSILAMDEASLAQLTEKLGITKADTINTATGLLWYDLRPVVGMMYPFRELIPLISKLPREPYNGGNAFHWKRITAINSALASPGVSEGNRGARIAITEQDQMATYKTMGLESSVTFEARLGALNLDPDALGIAVQSTLRATMIAEEQALLLANATNALGITPTPTLSAGAPGTGIPAGTIPTASPGLYVACVALTGQGLQGYTPYNHTSNTGGVPGQITKTNADGTTDTFGGGSAQPSAQASVNVTLGQVVTATVARVAGAVAYAWYAGTTATLYLAGISQSTEFIFATVPSNQNQPMTNLQVAASYVDNSQNSLLPDGILSQIFTEVFGAAPGTTMATNSSLPSSNMSLSNSGAIIYTAPPSNTGLTVAGTNIAEFDLVLQAAYDQYKIGFDKIYVSSADLNNFTGTMMSNGASSMFRIMFDAAADSGRLVAGRRVTSYMNKFYGNTLDIEVHPFLPPGTVLFWSDRVPYELPGVKNLLEARVRQDYYQIQWPLSTRRYEYGVYVDEVFACYFCPAFAAITNLNPSTGPKYA